MAAAAGGGGASPGAGGPTHDWQTPMRFVVAVDGSGASLAAFDEVAAFAREGDAVSVLHIGDDSKPALTLDQRSPAVHSFYQSQCAAHFKPGRWAVNVYHKREGRATRDEVVFHTQRADADMLVLGYVGRKGVKEDPTILGSTADASLRSAHVTAMVVKSGRGAASAATGLSAHGRLAVQSQPRKYVVAVDGSLRGHQAFLLAMRLARPGSKDSVLALHVEEHHSRGDPKYDAEAVEERYSEVVKVAGEAAALKAAEARAALRASDAAGPLAPVAVAFKRVQALADDATAADALVRIAEEVEGCDSILVGVDGINAFAEGRPTSLSSFSDRVMKRATVNVVVVQPPRTIRPLDVPLPGSTAPPSAARARAALRAW